jgi:transcription initiation factor TFIID subunit 9B
MPYQVPKADLIEMALETNRIGLPPVRKEYGIRLPSDKFLLTGGTFRLQDEWEEDDVPDDEDEDVAEPMDSVMKDRAEGEEDDGGLLDDEDMEEDEFEEVMGIKSDTKMEG